MIHPSKHTDKLRLNDQQGTLVNVRISLNALGQKTPKNGNGQEFAWIVQTMKILSVKWQSGLLNTCDHVRVKTVK